ncbi:5-dehydro-2-deoxygluconokinase [Echinicola jeungdonensis]|uniref:5-dehydro-2-deoxygluconokinase n=1 Tax=Echinicola jeungdonensis TaxID=709343 RepID=A0ABV5JBN4_9BACT|nr:5-dehydro-2-deoxygluconokinase [Echinicola jeungdonensis]MDN3670367.1 5-dehydro-2-deoxygluconokinase [Echinicola jeungdonensis]
MANKNEKPDVITIGRSSIDLYSQNIGADFIDIKGFDAFVGGSPLNIATGCARLGINTALLTGVGEDKVGDFILNFLDKEGVGTQFIPKIPGARSSAVILGIQPPDRFPLVYYRDNCADSQITIDHVINANVGETKLVEISATAMNVEPSRSSVFFAVEEAYKANVPVLLDIDFRADQWSDIRSFGLMVRNILPKVKIALGTEEEILAAMLQDAGQVKIEHQQISAPKITGNIDEAIERIMDLGVEILVVKSGGRGVTVYDNQGQVIEVPGFPVEPLNVLGAGDAFASGFIYGYLQGWDLYKSCRMGNASGAQVVLQPGCANFMPTLEESLDFIEAHGGFYPVSFSEKI